MRIEDYALIGDTHTVALVGNNGSIDWLCLPRFDSGACFAALLGDEGNGRWLLAPSGGVRNVSRRYRGGTMVLETDFECETGTVRIVDCMPIRRHRHPLDEEARGGNADVVRLVQGISGRVPMHMELVVRFDYGSVVPWVRRMDDGSQGFIAGPDALSFVSPVDVQGEDFKSVADFDVASGEIVPFVLTWHRSHKPPPKAVRVDAAIAETEEWWARWTSRTTYEGRWGDAVGRSLTTLKALTYSPTGGIVAAATTSLPEHIGGVRNWDYRYCWLRDATFTLQSLLVAGYTHEAKEWRDWLLRAVAGQPSALQIMYGAAGERRLTEWEVPWLAGYEASAPVRVGNTAALQFQLDVYGEVLDALHQGRKAGIEDVGQAQWALQRALFDFLEGHWQDPDEGIWEVRGPRRHFTHSKVMAWVGFDRAVRAAELFGLDGPVDQWRRTRKDIRQEIYEKGFDPTLNSFTQSFGDPQLDSSLLLIPLVGFLPATDPRMAGTIEAIEKTLVVDGFVQRYQSSETDDGLPPGEGSFVACSFWLADNLALAGRTTEATAMFERLLALRNDVGLLAEEYDPVGRRQLGNFPQAYSHVSLINTAMNLSGRGPAQERGDGRGSAGATAPA